MSRSASLQRIDHVAMNVRDLHSSFDWYHRVFGFEIIHKWNSTWMIGSATMRLGLFERQSAVTVDDKKLDHLLVLIHFAFLTDRAGFESERAALTQLGVPFEVEDTGIAWSLFVRDPDDHKIEITSYK